LELAVISLAAEERGPRFAALDVLRGVAVAAMVVYHASWDLRAFNLISADVVNELGWRLFARTIAGTFVALVGVNLVLATRRGFRPRPYLRLLAILIVAAGLVSAGTYYMDARTFVFFGILHMIALGSVLALPFLFAPLSVVGIAAVLCLLAPHYLTFPLFEGPEWWWLGLTPDPPPTVDYVPILPWFGVILGGIVAGRLFVARGGASAFARWLPSHAVERLVAFVGRWSLAVYVIHQPILIGALFLVAPLLAPAPQVAADQFTSECTTSCRTAGRDVPTCEMFCGCVLSGLEQAKLPTEATGDSLSAADRDRWLGIVKQCRPAPPSPPATGN
jgi:uncharacterized membrane protein